MRNSPALWCDEMRFGLSGVFLRLLTARLLLLPLLLPPLALAPLALAPLVLVLPPLAPLLVAMPQGSATRLSWLLVVVPFVWLASDTTLEIFNGDDMELLTPPYNQWMTLCKTIYLSVIETLHNRVERRRLMVFPAVPVLNARYKTWKIFSTVIECVFSSLIVQLGFVWLCNERSAGFLIYWNTVNVEIL